MTTREMGHLPADIRRVARTQHDPTPNQEHRMNLGSIITALEAADPQQPVPHGFANPHSYRGDYMDLAFEPTADTTVSAMLTAARSALGATFQGWKGGDFLMDADTWCWLSPQGDASCETLSPEALAWMLRPAATVTASAPTDRTALRDRAEAVLHAVEAALGDTLLPDAREEALAGITAVLPAPADHGTEIRATALREAAADLIDPTRTAAVPPLPASRLVARTANESTTRHDAATAAGQNLSLASPSSDRAALLHEAIARVEDPEERAKTTVGLGFGWESARDVLRRMLAETDESRVAAEEQPAEAHSCRNCEGTDPDTCLMNPDRPADSRPRCPDCQMPHDLTPGMALACASIRASIADQQRPAVGEQPDTQETRPRIPCGWAHTLHEHTPHDWQPQPGTDPVHCPGYPQDETPATTTDTEPSGCWCGHPQDQHWTGATHMTFPDGCHDCRGWNGAHGYGQELPWLPEGDAASETEA